MKKLKISIVCLILLSVVFTCVSFLFLNDTIPTHFGIDGKPDRFGSKYFMILFPAISTLAGTTMLLVIKYANVTENYKKYTLITGVILESVFLLLNVLFSTIALLYVEDAPAFDFSKIILIIFGIMFIIMGNYMPKIEKNRTLGVKIKWSMYNEVTWQKTHRFAGFAGVVVGALSLISALLFKEMINFVIFMSLITIFIISTSIAAYHYYKQEITNDSIE